MTHEPRGHVFPKWGPRGPFRVYSWTQATVTVLGLLFSALMLVAGMGGPALLLVVLLGSLTLRDPTGRPAWTRVGLGLRFLVGGWTGARSWTSTTAGDVPRWLQGVEVVSSELPQGLMGMVKDRGRYLVAMRIAPTCDPWLQSPADREIAADDWARLVTSIPTEVVDRLQVITVSREGGGERILADAESASGPGLEVVKEVATQLATGVRTTESYLVIRLSLPAAKDAHRRGGEEAASAVLYSALQHLGTQLPPEQVTAEILAPGDWLELLQSVVSAGVPGDDLGLADIGEVQEKWNTLRLDKTYHRVMWLWQWPQRPMAAGFLAPLLTGPGDRIVSLTVAPADPESHQRSLDWAYRRAQAAAETAKSSKHRKEAELESLDRQLRELNEGHIPVKVLATVSVSASNIDYLDDLTGTVRANAVAGTCRVAPFGGDQQRAFSWVLPLCRGLDKGVDG